MTVAPGTRIGVYEITALLGEGGMGQVYRATDTKLKRQVAIKILPPALAADADRLARFQREAEVLASLNHPNIAGIYGLEESDGTIALVMELVEGEDLSLRIARGAIPIDEALPIAKQIAEALEAAHEQGIVHRDLKPANIKVRADGTVKVLDFGLAKAMEPAVGPSPAVSVSPTITSPAMTQAGIILGTAAYMSPEQARGKVVDRRADIWAFGCVLYEMLTGQRAFGGEDMTVTLARVVEREPDFSVLPSSVPPRVAQALRVCLRKDPKQRAQAIGDVRLALEGAFETASSPPATTASRTRERVAWVAVSAAAVAAIWLAVPASRSAPRSPLAAPFEIRTEINSESADEPTSFALAPDGRQIVYVAGQRSQLWLRAMGSETPRLLSGTEGAAFPFWSPDSKSIGFFADLQIKRIDVSGGLPRTLTTMGVARGGTWNDAGAILFATNTGPLRRISASGGDAVAVTSVDRQVGHRFPSFLPDGKHFLFYALSNQDKARTGIFLGSLEGSPPVRLAEADTAAAYRPDGWIVWVQAGVLLAQRLDLTASALSGSPVKIAEPAGYVPNVHVGALSVSASGLIAYRPGTFTRRQLTWVDRSGKVLGTAGEPDDAEMSLPSVSPDGRQIVYTRTIDGNQDLWLLDGIRKSRFTFTAGEDRDPIWSPDGQRVAFDSNRNGVADIYTRTVNGSSGDSVLVASPQSKNVTDWSSDGQFVLFHSSTPTTGGPDVWAAAVTGERRSPWGVANTPFVERNGRASPDGQWLAYMSNESGRMEIYVRRFAAPKSSGAVVTTTSRSWPVSTSGGVFPSWRADGKALHYLSPDGSMMETPVTMHGDELDLGKPVALFNVRVFGGGLDRNQGRQYDETRDGRFLINMVLDVPSPITLIQNWRPDANPQ